MLTPNTEYTISTRTVDTSGNINTTWVNNTTTTLPPPDTTPPLITNPTATPDTIAPDATQQTRLNATITDKTGILSVTIDLSLIGANPSTQMQNIPGTDIYTTTTTATSGTQPTTYDLRINATDNSPNRNSNTTVSISLTILPQEAISTYNFSTGAGEDKWAFRKQHNKKPPAVNNVPNIEFSSPRYEKIMADDDVMQKDRTTARKRYAVHRFNFTIQEPGSGITGIDVLWDGKGYKRFGRKGAAIYVWNFTDSCYEKLSSGTSTYLTLKANITENVEDYIADDGTFIIIAQQNRRQTWFGRPSRIGTDYIRVNVTYEPQSI